MAYIREYWNDKGNRAVMARNHTKEMGKKYRQDIIEAVDNTQEYYTPFSFIRENRLVSDEFICGTVNEDSVSSIFNHYDGKTAVLNFASYKNPGGMFIEGSKAQEECLCHESFLYNVLSSDKLSPYYEWNNQHKNKALYLNRGLYSPDIVFEKDGKSIKCDVITCAAPNKSAAQQYQEVTDEENTEALKSRIKFILDIAAENRVNTLILGAYGCGVFGQDATEVATIFKDLLIKDYKCFNKVIFAVPQGRGNNYEKFVEIFGNSLNKEKWVCTQDFPELD